MCPPLNLSPFSFLSDKSDKPRNATVTQKFGSVICEERRPAVRGSVESQDGEERRCNFGTVTTTVQVSVELKITSVTQL